jgi:ankyrin repeat protein
LDIARERFNTDVVKFLEEKTEPTGKEMVDMGFNNKVEELRQAEKDYPGSVNKTDNDGETALHGATWNGSVEVAKVLVEELGADLNKRNKYGETALDQAKNNNRPEMVKLLEEKMG